MDVILAVAGTLGMHVSTDGGASWTEKTHPKSGFSGKSGYGNGVWLWVQSNEPSSVAYVSTDLNTWLPVTLPAVKTWTQLKFMLGEFYLFTTTTAYYKSVDGEVWVAHVAPVATTLYSLIAASPARILLLETKHASPTNVYATTDGVNWSLAGAHAGSASATRKGMFWTGGSFSIYWGVGITSALDKSVDGAAWATTYVGSVLKNMYAADEVIGCAGSSSDSSGYKWLGDSTSYSTMSFGSSGYAGGIYVIAGRVFVSRSATVDYSDDTVTWVTPVYNFVSNISAMVGGEFPDVPVLMDTLTFSSLLEGSVSEVAISHDTLTFSSSALTLTELFTETYFDTLLLSDILTSSQSLTADLVSTLHMSTLIGGVVLADGGRVLLSEPIQYGVNVATGALTRYQGFGFDSYARCGQTLYGLRADGLYRIRPGSDNGQPIQVAIDLGDTPFSEEQGKRIEAVYLGISTDGDAYVRLKAGEAEYTYKAIQHDEMARAVPGKGLTGRRWTLSLEVVDATELTLDMVEVRYGASTRRLRGKS